MKKFYHIGFNFKGKDSQITALVEVFNDADDWVRYAPNCWLIWDDKTPRYWFKRVQRMVGEEPSIFICEVDLANRSGWLPKTVWEWINRERE